MAQAGRNRSRASRRRRIRAPASHIQIGRALAVACRCKNHRKEKRSRDCRLWEHDQPAPQQFCGPRRQRGLTRQRVAAPATPGRIPPATSEAPGRRGIGPVEAGLPKERRRVAAPRPQARKLSADPHARRRHGAPRNWLTPCPCLRSDRCGVSESRPMACRTLLNLDDDRHFRRAPGEHGANPLRRRHECHTRTAVACFHHLRRRALLGTRFIDPGSEGISSHVSSVARTGA